MLRINTLITLALMIATPAWSLSLQEKEEDFRQLVDVIEADYGPLEFKRNSLGIDLELLVDRYSDEIPRTGNDSDFFYLLGRFVAEFKDSHFDVRVPTKHESYLGFSTDYVRGKVVVESVDVAALPVSQFPFGKGDEIVAVNGQAVAEELAHLSSYFGFGSDETTLRMAAFSIPSRPAKYLPPQSGKVALSIRRHGSLEVIDTELEWKQKGEPYQVSGSDLNEGGPAGKSDWCSSQSRIKIPGNAIVDGDVPFTAYTFEFKGQTLGFIRIPHYYPRNPETGEDEFEIRFRQYERMIAKYENATDALIIDQDYNCGGSIAYVMKMIGLFVDTPFLPPPFEFRASETQIDALKGHLPNYSAHPLAHARFKSVIEEVEAAFDLGAAMTSPISFWGFMEHKVALRGNELVNPNAIRYSKPVIMTINAMSGSGGDLFPAMMQDFGRAKLVGRPTMGAGGHTWDDPKIRLKNSGLTVNLTRSLILRPNGEYIENNGVRPDADYEPTMADFLDGYQQYLNALSHIAVRQAN